MSKNSGKRRAAKQKKAAAKQKEKQKDKAKGSGNDGAVINVLREWLARRNPVDALMALLASELWLPNIGAQVKHGFVYSVFVAMQEDEFDNQERIQSHEQLDAFLNGVFARVPSFPMLEDYVPELDWGSVKTAWGSDLVRMFYSGYLERIPDQVDAFRIKFHGSDRPLHDMEVVLRAQDYLINGMSQIHPDAVATMAPGYREIPPAFFWESAKQALSAFGDFVHLLSPRHALVCELGAGMQVSNMRSFGSTLMDGQLMPAPFVRIGSTVLPLFPRNMAGWVIDHWGNSAEDANRSAQEVVRGVATFLRARFQQTEINTGPYRIVRRDGVVLPFSIAGFFLESGTLAVIVVADDDELEHLPEMYSVIEKTITSSIEWGFRDDQRRIISPRYRDGRSLATINLAVVVVVPKVTTASVMLRIRPSPAKLMYLSDFVAIFDALRDVEELLEFWKFRETEKHTFSGAMFGATDMFGAFRQSHGTIVPGAREYTMVMLDPHTGSGWRFDELKRFWDHAPTTFPDDSPRSWKLDEDKIQVWTLGDKRRFAMATSAAISTTGVHFVANFPTDMEEVHARVLNVFAECLADFLATRKTLVQALPLFANQRIVTFLHVSPQEDVELREEKGGVLTAWRVQPQGLKDIQFHVDVDLGQVQAKLQNASDASFEADAAIEWLGGASRSLNLHMDEEALAAIRQTSVRPARFTLTQEVRLVDAPDGRRADYPQPAQFKVARQSLAHAFARQSVVPGRYELAEAKAIISPVLTSFRDEVQQMMLSYDRDHLLLYAMEQFDALLADNNYQMRRVQLSQAHEVDYDRNRRVMDSYAEFIRQANTYRYLIEATLSLNALSSSLPAARPNIAQKQALELLAAIDWLLVIYDADNALHYGIQPGGIEVDDDWVPQVFYATLGNDEAMQEEQAVEVLGQGLNRSDEPSRLSAEEQAKLNAAFLTDAGFSLRTLLTVLGLLRHWQRLNGRDELHLSYCASESQIIQSATDVFEELEPNEFKHALAFLTIDPEGIRRLTGVPEPASDVPVWEHRKRAHRISIRPIVRLEDGRLMWGAAGVDRAYRIWAGTFGDGYLPADFSWPNVDLVTEEVKKRIEREIEHRAFDIIRRFTPYVAPNVDLRRRFPSHGFEEIGDYDVLAYFPYSETWICVEAKYNKPPFTVKDSRRLRDDIFGPKGHIFKSSRRSSYLSANASRIATLLGWPASQDSEDRIVDLYVCPRIMYWMRNPPVPVSTEFVRLSALENWLIEYGFQAEVSAGNETP